MEASLALIAHRGRQLDMVELAVRHVRLLRCCALVATEATGKLLEDEVGLRVERLTPGPVAARVAMGEVDAVVFLVDSRSGHRHEPDLRGLLRVCNLHDVPLATNLGSADLLMDAVAASWLAVS